MILAAHSMPPGVSQMVPRVSRLPPKNWFHIPKNEFRRLAGARDDPRAHASQPFRVPSGADTPNSVFRRDVPGNRGDCCGAHSKGM